jgi:hypothetical protein
MQSDLKSHWHQILMDIGLTQLATDCLDFDWSQINPAIFGSMFQGVMDKDARREIGAHYTTEENILKLINPLFLDDLKAEFAKAKKKASIKALDEFHGKIAKLKFLDPACGCGNFLIIAYRELRKLEHEVLREQRRIKGEEHQLLNLETHLKVSVQQFFGIEILSWPCQIAKTGLWLMDHLMNMEASEIFGKYHADFPLGEGAMIAHGNAHRMDWESIVPKNELSYILGNPPFAGARGQGQKAEDAKRKKEDMHIVFGDMKGIGSLDYVTAWYKKASEMMENAKIQTAFVSTNSITQGEQAAILWKPLMKRGIYINFGIPTFKWTSEAKGKAAVHCVIVGFSCQKTEPNINPYLVEAPNIFIEGRTSPISEAPPINYGSFALDDGNYTITADEYNELVNAEPCAKKFLRPFLGARELLHNEKRYCVWLLGADPSEISESKTILKKIGNVRDWRAKSSRKNTIMLAETPTLFAEIRQPETSYLAIPTVSSENRKYIPIAYLRPETIASNQLYVVPNATLYHFGILTSNLHNAWIRAVCGRLKSDYRYSSAIVYNNFPWPDGADKQNSRVEEHARNILEIREQFFDSPLAILYNPLSMPPELHRAHKKLDNEVMKLYGLGKDLPEPAIVAALMERHQKLLCKIENE